MKFAEYKETMKRGSRSFPIQYYHVDKGHPNYVMPLHWQSEFEIIHVKRGRLQLFLNNELYVGEPGAVFFISPGILHRAEPLDCVYECAVFDLKLLSGYGESKMSEFIRPLISSEMEADVICGSASEAVYELFSVISVESEFYEFSVISALNRIFFYLYSSGAVKGSQKKNKAFNHKRSQMILLLDRIDEEYTHKISLSELAEESGLNEKYLFRIFKEFTGQTPTEYINSMRIDRACYEMKVVGLSVTDAAYESGFNELSYFSRVFKKYKGITPGEYKKSIAKA